MQSDEQVAGVLEDKFGYLDKLGKRDCSDGDIKQVAAVRKDPPERV